ncbi:peptidoglycan D,D-transpeptidase FtsI family protein [Paenibacillus sp. CAU 1782]
MFRRAAITGVAITIMMLLFLGRLAYVQLMPGTPVSMAGKASRENLKRQAVVQRQRSLVLDSGRGDFTDRFGRSITGESYQALALFPISRQAREREGKLNKLAEWLGVKPEVLERSWGEMTTAELWRDGDAKTPMRLSPKQAEGITGLDMDGVRVVPYRSRYRSGFEAKHWIGFIGEHPEWLLKTEGAALREGRRRLDDQIGGSGLEKSLDSVIHGVGKSFVSYYMDGLGNPLHGLSTTFHEPGNPYYPLRVVTTIDLELQNKLEDYADRQGLAKGAIVVLDAANGDIIAMVSRPKLNPGQFVAADGSEWENHALKAVEPGSIFKLVTAAAALEYGAVKSDEVFICNGHYGKYGLSCWKHGGHGALTLREGIAQSCNIVFATIAERLSGRQLEQMAGMLGMTGRIGWHADESFGPFANPLRLLEEEENGRVFAGGGESITDGGILAQSGIGQRDVRLSPLAAANLIVTLLDNGRVMEPRLVSSILYGNGQTMVKLPRHHKHTGSGRRISASTAHALLQGMEDVVAEGTGKGIKAGTWRLAGKTGTAETTLGSQKKVHQWFAGYGPVGKPRYAVSVLASDRPVSSPHQATVLFRGVMELAAKHEAGRRSGPL